MFSHNLSFSVICKWPAPSQSQCRSTVHISDHSTSSVQAANRLHRDRGYLRHLFRQKMFYQSVLCVFFSGQLAYWMKPSPQTSNPLKPHSPPPASFCSFGCIPHPLPFNRAGTETRGKKRWDEGMGEVSEWKRIGCTYRMRWGAAGRNRAVSEGLQSESVKWEPLSWNSSSIRAHSFWWSAPCWVMSLRGFRTLVVCFWNVYLHMDIVSVLFVPLWTGTVIGFYCCFSRKCIQLCISYMHLCLYLSLSIACEPLQSHGMCVIVRHLSGCLSNDSLRVWPPPHLFISLYQSQQ